MQFHCLEFKIDFFFLQWCYYVNVCECDSHHYYAVYEWAGLITHMTCE